MIHSHFEDLRRLKALRDRRALPLRTIVAETGLSMGSLLRIKNLKTDRISLATLVTLCRYFEVKSISELLEWDPEEN